MEGGAGPFYLSYFDLLNWMIISSRWSVDLRWMFENRCYIHLRWYCSLKYLRFKRLASLYHFIHSQDTCWIFCRVRRDRGSKVFFLLKNSCLHRLCGFYLPFQKCHSHNSHSRFDHFYPKLVETHPNNGGEWGQWGATVGLHQVKKQNCKIEHSQFL